MSDEIMHRFHELSLMNVIPDIRQYAVDWNSLAQWADIDGRPATAETCRKKAEHYRSLAVGEYIRLIENNIAELIPT